MKNVMLTICLAVLLAGMVLVQGCIDREEIEEQARKDIQQIKEQVAQKLEYQKEIDAANTRMREIQKQNREAKRESIPESIARPSEPVEKDRTDDAWCIAQQFIEQRAKCPRTVKWTWGGHSDHTTNLGGGRYRYAYYFDAQNGFGAMVRTHFVCVVKYIGEEKWRLESLTF